MTTSRNPHSGSEFQIPDNMDDSFAIDEFLSKHPGKKVIAVQGLGFVGSVMAIVCANAIRGDYAVIGVDIANEQNYWKIASLNEGVFPLIAEDPNIEILFRNCTEQQNFFATYDPAAFSKADVIIVDINLDAKKKSNKDFSLSEYDVDLDGFKSAIRSIGFNCKEDALILVETTVPPGTCEKIVKPTIHECLEQRGLRTTDVKIGHSYERVMPGPDYVDSIRAFPRVYSGVDENSAEVTFEFLKTIIDTDRCPLTRLGHTNATEIAKVLENSYRAMNIAFTVEWSRFAEEAGVNLYEIVNAIRVRPTHSNLMFPGIGVGGYCLTKDPLLASWARENHFASSGLAMSVSGVSTNDQMPRFAFERLEKIYGSIKDKKICFLGVSYRGDVGDTRFSPVERFVKLAQERSAIITLHDPFVKEWGELFIDITSDLASALQTEPDVIIISTGHSAYKNSQCTEMLLSAKPALIYDTVGLLSDEQIGALGTKHRISVLGRGNL